MTACVLTVGFPAAWVEVLRGGGRCRLTAAWVRYRVGCNLISLPVVCTIIVRCPIFVRFLAFFLFPSFPMLGKVGIDGGIDEKSFYIEE
jgi:hypothetical protein